MLMSAPSISSITNTARNIPTLKIYEDFDKIIAKEVFFTETGEQSLEVEYMFPPKKKPLAGVRRKESWTC